MDLQEAAAAFMMQEDDDAAMGDAGGGGDAGDEERLMHRLARIALHNAHQHHHIFAGMRPPGMPPAAVGMGGIGGAGGGGAAAGRPRWLYPVLSKEYDLELDDRTWSFVKDEVIDSSPFSSSQQQQQRSYPRGHRPTIRDDAMDRLLDELRMNRSIRFVDFGYHFLTALSDAQQETLFATLVTGPCPLRNLYIGDGGRAMDRMDGVVTGSSLLPALQELPDTVRQLVITGLRLDNPEQLQDLASIVRTKFRTVGWLKLSRVSLTYYDGACEASYGLSHANKRKTGILDPILSEMSHMESAIISDVSWSTAGPMTSSTAGSNNSSSTSGCTPPPLVGTDGLRVLLEQPKTSLSLAGLGMDNDHCRAMAAYSREHPIAAEYLYLTQNPAVDDAGYQACLQMLNYQFCIRSVDVDDKEWQDKFRLVVDMNQQGRGQYLHQGNFSRPAWLSWLCELARSEKRWSLDGIYFTLQEKPHFIYQK